MPGTYLAPTRQTIVAIVNRPLANLTDYIPGTYQAPAWQVYKNQSTIVDQQSTIANTSENPYVILIRSVDNRRL